MIAVLIENQISNLFTLLPFTVQQNYYVPKAICCLDELAGFGATHDPREEHETGLHPFLVQGVR